MLPASLNHVRTRRAFVLLAVLVIVPAALLVVTGLLVLAHAESAGAAAHARAIQSRARLWSGIQAVMTRLDEQRDEILAGRLPRLEDQYTVDESSGRRGVVRLLPAAGDGRRLVPEAGKLDVNAADADALAATGLVDAALAAAIIENRTGAIGRPFRAAEELLSVPGITADLLYGPLDALAVEPAAPAGIAADAAGPRKLLDRLTVFAVEPALQRDGKLRINLNVPWSEELARRVDDRFGDGAGEALRRIMAEGTTFARDADIVRTLRSFNVPPQNWPPYLDTFTTGSGEHLFGRIDLNTAHEEALRGIPGIDADLAARIVASRSQLTSEQRATPAWPVLLGIIPPEDFAALADRVTTRSWTYRLRLAAGEVDADEADAPGGTDLPMRDTVACEVIIDLSSPRPRVAYLREVTLLRAAAVFLASESPEEVDGNPTNAFNDADERGSGAPPDGASAEAGLVRPPPATTGGPPSAEQPPPAEAGAANPVHRRTGRWTPAGGTARGAGE
jgi:DNA uptake protein ComE-like DNA-binding protein